MSPGSPPLKIDGRAPEVMPVCPLPRRARDKHPLYVLERTIYLRTPFGWERIPRGYVTDMASDPVVVTLATGLLLQPLGPWAWGALSHDWGYAIGEPGRKPTFDETFRAQMALDGVDVVRRVTMYEAVRLGGAGGYAKAKTWWDTENFADPDTGEYPVRPPFRREEAFAGGPWGLRPQPDWNERLAA